MRGKLHKIPEGMITVEAFASRSDLASDEIIDMIRNGFYVGQVVDNQWYIDPDSVVTVFEGPEIPIVPNHSIILLVKSIIITGLLLPSVLAIIVRTYLWTKGVDVVSLIEGAKWIIPLTIVFFVPFLILAFLTRRILLRTLKRNKAVFSKWLNICVGALIGTTTILGYLLVGILQSMEAVAYWPFLWPITLPRELLHASGGALLGGLFGWLWWVVRYKSKPQQ